MTERTQTLGEEIANSVSHGVALLAGLIGIPFLLVSASHLGPSNVVGAAVFAVTLVLLYAASTLYHALPSGPAKRVFQKLDHSAIYFFIAGSYTPFALGALAGPWGWTLFGLVWSLAIFGATLKLYNRLSHPWLSTGLYLGMGWLVLIAAVPLMRHVQLPGLELLVAGGVAYTAGVVFYVLDSRWRYAHTVWHAFVMTGTALHFFAIFGYAA
jgi:hemolysin III